MDLQQLIAFSIVAQERSFTNAAIRLNVTQPTVTSRIKALETELGVKLFLRKARSIELSSAGACLLPYAERALEILQEGQKHVSQMRDYAGVSVSIGATYTLGHYVLPPVFHDIHRQFPSITLNIRTGLTGQMLQMLLDRIIDIAVIKSWQINYPDISAVLIGSDPIIPVCAPDHPLTQLSSVTMETLSSQPILASNRNSGLWKVVESFFKELGIRPRVIMESDSIESLKKGLPLYRAVAFLPEHTIIEELNKGLIVRLPVVGAEQLKQGRLLAVRIGEPFNEATLQVLTVMRQWYPDIPEEWIAKGKAAPIPRSNLSNL